MPAVPVWSVASWMPALKPEKTFYSAHSSDFLVLKTDQCAEPQVSGYILANIGNFRPPNKLSESMPLDVQYKGDLDNGSTRMSGWWGILPVPQRVHNNRTDWYWRKVCIISRWTGCSQHCDWRIFDCLPFWCGKIWPPWDPWLRIWGATMGGCKAKYGLSQLIDHSNHVNHVQLIECLQYNTTYTQYGWQTFLSAWWTSETVVPYKMVGLASLCSDISIRSTGITMLGSASTSNSSASLPQAQLSSLSNFGLPGSEIISNVDSQARGACLLQWW